MAAVRSPLMPDAGVLAGRVRGDIGSARDSDGPTEGLVLMTPTLEPRRTTQCGRAWTTYGAAVKRIAAKHNACFVDTQAAFASVLQEYYSAYIAATASIARILAHGSRASIPERDRVRV